MKENRGACDDDGQCNAENCKFYYTRPYSTPIEYESLFQAAMMFREARMNENRRELDYYYDTLPFWATQAYYAYERSYRIVENEEAEKANKGDKGRDGDMRITRTGSEAFAAIEKDKLMRENASADGTEGLAYLEKRFSDNPNLSDEIFDFFESHE